MFFLWSSPFLSKESTCYCCLYWMYNWSSHVSSVFQNLKKKWKRNLKMERYLTPSFVLIMLSSRYQHLIRHVSQQVNTTRAPQSNRTTKAEYECYQFYSRPAGVVFWFQSLNLKRKTLPKLRKLLITKHQLMFLHFFRKYILFGSELKSVIVSCKTVSNSK